MLVPLGVLDLSNPTEFIQLVECFRCVSLAQRLGHFLVIALLTKNFRDLHYRQPRPFFQELQRLTRRDAAMLPSVADQDHPRIETFSRLEHLQHVTRTEQTCLINEDHAIPCRILHLLIFEKPGNCVRVLEPRFFAHDFTTGFHGLGDCDDGTTCFCKRLANFLLQCRLPRSGDASNHHHAITRAEHMRNGRLLALVEPMPRTRPLGVAQRSIFPTAIPSEFHQA